jgi:hypothetical protein
MWVQQRLDGVKFGGLSIQALDQVQVARSKRANHRVNVSAKAPAELPGRRKNVASQAICRSSGELRRLIVLDFCPLDK